MSIPITSMENDLGEGGGGGGEDTAVSSSSTLYHPVCEYVKPVGTMESMSLRSSTKLLYGYYLSAGTWRHFSEAYVWSWQCDGTATPSVMRWHCHA